MLELSSNTIKVLGIFGRLSADQEAYFDSLENKYGYEPDNKDAYDIFRHLTLTFIPNATISDVSSELELLKNLKQFLPLKIKPKKPFVKDEESQEGAEHVAIEFELDQTNKITEYIKGIAGENTVETWYIKVVWFVPRENQQAVMDELAELKELEFTDFYLVSNKQNEENTIFTSNRF
jgi:hypothetical protein